MRSSAHHNGPVFLVVGILCPLWHSGVFEYYREVVDVTLRYRDHHFVRIGQIAGVGDGEGEGEHGSRRRRGKGGTLRRRVA